MRLALILALTVPSFVSVGHSADLYRVSQACFAAAEVADTVSSWNGMELNPALGPSDDHAGAGRVNVKPWTCAGQCSTSGAGLRVRPRIYRS